MTTPSAADVARGHAAEVAGNAGDRAGAVAQHARGAAADVASTAREQTTAVKDETVAQARDLFDQARGQLTQQANGQLKQLGSTVRTMASQLEEMARKSQQDQQGEQSQPGGPAVSAVSATAHHAHRLADFIEGRELGDILNDVRYFARRRPGAFLLGAAGAGLLVGRLSRGLRDASGSADTRSSYPAEPYPGLRGEYAAPAEITLPESTYSESRYESGMGELREFDE